MKGADLSMSKFKIDRSDIQPPLVAGRYWVKECLPDRNTKYVLLTKVEDGPWHTGWMDKSLMPVELRGEYTFMGPIPADVYLP